MIGRDYNKFGIEKYIVNRFGDGNGFPFKGPTVKVKFLNRKYIAVIDVDKNVHIQNISGPVEITLCSEKSRLAMVKEQEQLAKHEDTATEGDEWMAKFLEKNSKEDEQLNIVNWEQSYLSINANDVCSIPLSKNMAVGDFTNCIKFINKTEYYLDKSIGQPGDQPGSFTTITGIDCFKVGYDITFCVCEAGAVHRIQLLNEYGKSLFSIGEFGPALGQFKGPTAISATNVFSHWSESKLTGPNNPKWYKDFDSVARLREYIEAETVEPGNFYVSQRIQEKGVFDLVYVNYDYTTLNIVLRTIVCEDTGLNKVVLDSVIGVTDKNKYNSVWDIIKTFYGLKIPDDHRPYMLIAVCDRDNLRIQIFRYYWVKSSIFVPSLEPFLIVGGVNNKRCHLSDPVSCAYAQSGELAICDSGAKKVIIMSSQLEIIREISMAFSNPNYRKLADSKFKLASYISNSYSTDASTRINVDDARMPVSCAFSPDGRLAVAYRNGGVVLHSGVKFYPMGDLLLLPQIALDKILQYSTYTEVVSLRNCCRYLHNFTRRKRFCWDISPLRREKFDSALFYFWKYAKMFNGQVDSEKRFLDESGQPVCERKLLGLCLGTKGGCAKSHKHISNFSFDTNDLKAIDHLHLDIDGYFTIINSLFGAKFLWSCERYVEELFRAHSVEIVLCHRKDPMTRQNETVRKVVEVPTSVLTLYEYLLLMAVCEEDFRGAKPFHSHSLFVNKSLERYLPKVSYDDAYVAQQMVTSKDSLKNYKDAIKDGINVSCLPSKSRLYVTVKDVSEETRRDGDAKEVHVQTFCHQSNRKYKRSGKKKY